MKFVILEISSILINDNKIIHFHKLFKWVDFDQNQIKIIKNVNNKYYHANILNDSDNLN